MQKKHKVVLALAVGMAAIWGYLLLPTETPEGKHEVEPSAKVARLFDRLMAKDFPFATVPVSKWQDPSVSIINGIKVPPVPDKKVNDSTLLGVDSDNNGIRDDIDRFIAEKFAEHSKVISEIQNDTRITEVALQNPSPQNKLALNKSTACMPDEALRLIVSSKIEYLLINTKERGRAYSALGGVSHDCKYYQ